MNITYLTNSFIPSRAANSVHVMKMCQAFAHNGHNVTLLVPDAKDELEQGVEDVFDYYGVDNSFTLQRVSWPNIKGKGYVFGFIAAKAALKYKPDIVYCRHLAGCYFSALLGQKVIFESHSPIAEEGKLTERLFKQLIKSRKLQKLVVITHTLKDDYEKRYPALKGKIIVAADGADALPAKMQPYPLANQPERLQVGYVGHLYKGKGMEVISQLAPLCPWADFHVVGGTPSDIKNWKQQCEASANITFYGHVAHKETVKFIQAFDVALLPNQSLVHTHGAAKQNIGEWTSPLKLFEYMSAGKAIVASRLPVLSEVLSDGVNGLLCHPEDMADWHSALLRLRDNKALADKLSKQALSDFEQKYTWQIRAKNLMEALA